MIDTDSLDSSDGGAPGDDAAVVACNVRTGTIAEPDFEWPVEVSGVWGDNDSWIGGISRDETVLALHKFETQTQQDVYVARKTGFGSFGEPTPIVQTSDREWPVFVDRDGQSLWFHRETSGNSDLFRVTVDGAFTDPFDLNSDDDESWLWRSRDGDRIYYTVNNVVTLANQESSGLVKVNDYPELGFPVNEFTLSCDEREIFFTIGSSEHQDLFWATRSTIFDQWTTPVFRVQSVNTGADEAHPVLSEDGQTLYLNHQAQLDGSGGRAAIKAATRK